jgi:peptidoglycan DL-endopeptidase CwlO
VLAARSRSALLELYSLDSRLGRAQAELSTIRAHSARLARERASVRHRLAVARETLAISERALAQRLRTLYEQGQTHPLEIILGAASLEEAVARLDGLSAAAQQDQAIIERTRAERTKFARLAPALAAKSAELRRLERAAVATTSALEQALSERAAYVDRLATKRRLNSAQIAAIERRARAAQTWTLVRPPEPVPAGEAALGSRTLSVWVTGYALRGRTASGLPVGWGVVAVDPAYIPLGTRLTIPGYGAGIAADIGGSVRGARIDIWFPTRAEALAWGQRTVTVTLH